MPLQVLKVKEIKHEIIYLSEEIDIHNDLDVRKLATLLGCYSEDDILKIQYTTDEVIGSLTYYGVKVKYIKEKLD